MTRARPRRLLSALALSLGSCMTLLPALPAHAEAPQVRTQAPGYYRLMVGQLEVTALFDGQVPLDAKLLHNISQRDIQRLLARQFQEGPAMQTAVNAYLVNTGSQLVLIDAGAAGQFGPSLGAVAANLQAAGYRPDQVDAVLLTHLHGDHAAGLLNADGSPAFPKARVYAAQEEADYWLSAAHATSAPEAAKPFFQLAQAAVKPYADAGRWQTFQAGSELLPGIRSVAAVGHTPGHSAYLASSGDASLLVWGDLVHNHAVQLAHPEVSIEFDVDQKKAVATRTALLRQVSGDKQLVAGMHMPFPGIGHVRKLGKDEYQWVPLPYAPLPAP